VPRFEGECLENQEVERALWQIDATGHVRCRPPRYCFVLSKCKGRGDWVSSVGWAAGAIGKD
jgi:hypothetical protein